MSIAVTKDTARLALQHLLQNVAPERIAAAIGPALKNLVCANYARLGPNKQGWPSTHFWADAISATSWSAQGSAVTVTTNKVGVRQRYLGGTITPGHGISTKTGQPTKYLAIPARQQAYGKTPATFPNLVPVIRRQGGKARPIALADPTGLILYWLVDRADQQPDPRVLPSDAEFDQAIDKALEPLLSSSSSSSSSSSVPNSP